MLIGCTVVPHSGETWTTATERFERMIGAPVTVARRFISGAPTRPFAQYPQFAADIGKRDRWVSFKGDPTDVQIDTFLRSIPADGYRTGVAWNHEPENDGGQMTPSFFRSRQARLLAACRRVNRADVYPMVVLMSWLERDGNPSTSSAQWFPDECSEFVLGLDPYDVRSTPRSMQQLAGPTLDLWRVAGGHRWAICETGTHRTGADAARWVDEMGAWCRSEGCDGVAWYEHRLPGKTIAGPLHEAGDEAAKAFGRLGETMTTYVYLRANEWGMRWARPPHSERLNDPEVYVHHTAGSRMSSDGATAFRMLNESAIANKGYSATDYDYLVHYDKTRDVVTIGEARGPWMSAATRDRNEEGEAVCLMGYFHPGHGLSERPTDAEVEGVARAIAWSVELGTTARDATILGHRDNPRHPGATGCPGDYLYARLPDIRRRVAELLDPPITDNSQGARMQALKPRVRLMDTRKLPTRVQPEQIVKVGTPPDRPSWARSALVNITVTETTGPGFVTAWDSAWADGKRPLVSDLNWNGPGVTIANTSLVPLAADGSFVVSPAGSSCHIIIDQQGWGE